MCFETTNGPIKTHQPRLLSYKIDFGVLCLRLAFGCLCGGSISRLIYSRPCEPQTETFSVAQLGNFQSIVKVPQSATAWPPAGSILSTLPQFPRLPALALALTSSNPPADKPTGKREARQPSFARASWVGIVENFSRSGEWLHEFCVYSISHVSYLFLGEDGPRGYVNNGSCKGDGWLGLPLYIFIVSIPRFLLFSFLF